LKTIPFRHRRQASTLIKQFENRGNELTWNSDGVVFIDQVSIPDSDIFTLFPYLFKHKHPKTLIGFEDFVAKLQVMGLSHLIVAKQNSFKKQRDQNQTSSNINWWFLD
jgi:hypothetical protein